MNMIKKYSPAFYLALIFGISLHHCTDQTLGDHLATDFPPELSECSFFGDLNQPDQMVRSSKEGEPWVICIREQLSLIGTDSYPLTDNYILAEESPTSKYPPKQMRSLVICRWEATMKTLFL